MLPHPVAVDDVNIVERRAAPANHQGVRFSVATNGKFTVVTNHHQLLACPLLPLSHSPPDPMAEGPTLPRAKACVGGGQRPGDVVLYMVYQPLTGGPYRRRIRRCQSRWLFFVRQRAHVL